jgi:hypothetical protein
MFIISCVVGIFLSVLCSTLFNTKKKPFGLGVVMIFIVQMGKQKNSKLFDFLHSQSRRWQIMSQNQKSGSLAHSSCTCTSSCFISRIVYLGERSAYAIGNF